MKNPDYHPDKAHLPSAEDMTRWRNGGMAKEMESRARVQRVVARFDRAKAARADAIVSHKHEILLVQ